VDVPYDVSPHDLLMFADSFYQGRVMPVRLNGSADVALTTREGTQYVLRPEAAHHYKPANQRDSLRDGYMLDIEVRGGCAAAAPLTAARRPCRRPGSWPGTS
jgi:hypothetical protein